MSRGIRSGGLSSRSGQCQVSVAALIGAPSESDFFTRFSFIFVLDETSRHTGLSRIVQPWPCVMVVPSGNGVNPPRSVVLLALPVVSFGQADKKKTATPQSPPPPPPRSEPVHTPPPRSEPRETPPPRYTPPARTEAPPRQAAQLLPELDAEYAFEQSKPSGAEQRHDLQSGCRQRRAHTRSKTSDHVHAANVDAVRRFPCQSGALKGREEVRYKWHEHPCGGFGLSE